MFSHFEQDVRVYAGYALRLIERPWEDRPRWSRVWMAVDQLWTSQSLSAVMLYRAARWIRERRIPFLPRLLDKLAMAGGNVYIGEQVDIGPGLYIAHGNVVIDGLTKIGAHCVINPWVTIGLSARAETPDRLFYGPTIGDDVYIGTGAKVLGEITVGDGAVIGANAVVLQDVPPHHIAVGAPARCIPRRDTVAGAPSGGPEPSDPRDANIS